MILSCSSVLAIALTLQLPSSYDAKTDGGGNNKQEKIAHKKAQIYLLNAEFEKAIGVYNLLIKLNPKKGEYHRDIAICYGRIFKAEESISHYKRYLELAPEASDAPQVRKMVEKYESSEKAPGPTVKELVGIEMPIEDQEEYIKADTLSLQGKAKEACPVYEKLRVKYPKSPKMYLKSANCHQLVGQNKKARFLLQEYLKKFPDAKDREYVEKRLSMIRD